MKLEYLECGIICSTHGVRGIVKVIPWCDSPKVLASAKRVYFKAGDEYREVKVETASQNGETVLLGLSGISSREEAQGYKSTVIYMKREDIPVPKGAMLIADMIGLPVVDVDSGRVYGTLSEVNDGVMYKLYTVKTESGDVLFPAHPNFVKEVSEERGVLIRPIPGFFEE